MCSTAAYCATAITVSVAYASPLTYTSHRREQVTCGERPRSRGARGPYPGRDPEPSTAANAHALPHFDSPADAPVLVGRCCPADDAGSDRDRRLDAGARMTATLRALSARRRRALRAYVAAESTAARDAARGRLRAAVALTVHTLMRGGRV